MKQVYYMTDCKYYDTNSGCKFLDQKVILFCDEMCEFYEQCIDDDFGIKRIPESEENGDEKPQYGSSNNEINHGGYELDKEKGQWIHKETGEMWNPFKDFGAITTKQVGNRVLIEIHKDGVYSVNGKTMNLKKGDEFYCEGEIQKGLN